MQRPRKSYVYFARAENGLIKIGMSHKVAKRINGLNTSSAVEVTLIGAVLCKDALAYERELHGKFARYRKRYDWFEPSSAIMRCIDDHRPRFVGRDQLNPEPEGRRSKGLRLVQVLDESGLDMDEAMRLLSTARPTTQTQ